MAPLTIFLMLISIGAGVGLGLLLARLPQKSGKSGPACPGQARPSEEESDVESEDPTAPIAPVIEIARSPHDRHRDLAIGNSLVKSLDLLDALLRSGERQTRESLLGQIGLLRTVFEGLLGACSFRVFRYETGLVIDSETRLRIQIVGGSSDGGASRIARVIREGVLYEPGGGEPPQIIRKVEVEIG